MRPGTVNGALTFYRRALGPYLVRNVFPRKNAGFAIFLGRRAVFQTVTFKEQVKGERRPRVPKRNDISRFKLAPSNVWLAS